ncbi:MAG: hypothetical protein KGL39_08185 [Patescibacteria group bacterium]|nr:hypothetical protein [Patescibacteria group bacterium]
MSTLRIVREDVNCPECGGCGHDQYRKWDTGEPMPCWQCDGAGTVPLSEVAEREAWSSGLCFPGDVPPAA